MEINKIIKENYKTYLNSKNKVISFLNDEYYTDNFGFQWNIFEFKKILILNSRHTHGTLHNKF